MVSASVVIVMRIMSRTNRAEVNDLHIEGQVQNNIFVFDVAVHNLAFMQVRHPRHDLQRHRIIKTANY